MGEYANYNGQEIKIGTCEDMYYLRADQATLVRPLKGNVNPVKDAESIRFRFPWPDEDGIEPGVGFHAKDYGRNLAVSGVEAPEEVAHYSIQFRNERGLLCSLPCPESKEGKASGIKIHYNGYSGKVAIVQQRLVEGQLVLICQCGSCGAAYRCPTIDDAQPVIDALLKVVEDSEREKKFGRPADARASFYMEVAKRIVDGYTKPNHWSKPVPLVPVAA